MRTTHYSLFTIRYSLLTLLALLALALVAASPARAQVATTTYSVASGAWTDLGAGPLRLQLLTQASDLVVCVSDARPAADAQCFVVPIFDQTPKDFPTASHVWAKARTGATSIAAAPISGASLDASVQTTNADIGAPSDPAWSGTGAGALGPVLKYEAAKAEAIRALLAGTLFVDGSGHVQPVSAASLPLPAGAATAANQPALNGDGGALAHVTNFPSTQPVAQADVRGSGTVNSATANATYAVALNNGEGVVSFAVTGLTASGATLAIEASDDSGTNWAAVNGIVPATGALFSTLTADQQFRVNSGGRTNVRLRVSATGTGTITVASNASSVSSAVAISSPVPLGQIAPVSSTALEACHVLKTAAGALVTLTAAIGATSGYALLFDAASVPADGAVTPVWFREVGSNGTNGGLSASWGIAALKFTNGITACFSTTGPFVKTASATAAFSAQVQ